MFSAPVESVAETKIFARSLPEGRQVLVYRMNLNTKQDNAMILPIPVSPGSAENAVQFVDLSGYASMMYDMEMLFPDPTVLSPPADPFGGPEAGEVLKVEDVGAFEASFVPAIKDFTRLDARFRLPQKVWDKLPVYTDFGFVVFKFRQANSEVHPMAFAFPRRDPARLFFPTVHVHDGEVHEEEEFDHVLYCQKIPGDNFPVKDWQESPMLPAAGGVNVVAARGIVDPRLHVYRRELKGRLPNRDTVLV
jgi:hypothetical protein